VDRKERSTAIEQDKSALRSTKKYMAEQSLDQQSIKKQLHQKGAVGRECNVQSANNPEHGASTGTTSCFIRSTTLEGYSLSRVYNRNFSHLQNMHNVKSPIKASSESLSSIKVLCRHTAAACIRRRGIHLQNVNESISVLQSAQATGGVKSELLIRLHSLLPGSCCGRQFVRGTLNDPQLEPAHEEPRHDAQGL
jgi:hypothetical protein